MLVTEIKDKVKEIIEYSEEKAFAIAFDGLWGCGKTFNINEYIESKNNFYYLSIFGMDSINTLMIKLSMVLDSNFITNISGKYFLNNSIKSKEKKNFYIVFDDIERKSNELKIVDFFAVVEGLNKLGFSIICLLNSKEIHEDYKGYIEKVFDYWINVNIDLTRFCSIVGELDGFDYNIARAKEYFNNWRLMIRSKKFYDDIIRISSVNNMDILEALSKNEFEFFESIVLAYGCIYILNNQEIKFDKDEFFNGEEEYDENLKKYGENIAKNLHSLRDKYSSFDLNIITGIINAINNNDMHLFINNFDVTERSMLIKKYPILKKEPFYLSDSGRKEYKSNFVSSIKENIVNYNFDKKIIMNFFVNFAKELNDKEIELIVEDIGRKVDRDNISALFDSYYWDNIDTKKIMDDIKEKILVKICHNETLEWKNKIILADQSSDYKRMSNFLSESRSENYVDIMSNILKDNSFFLPDLSAEINPQSWEYCHTVAGYCVDYGMINEFITELEEQCKKSESIILRQRCNAIAKYRLKIQIDFFDKKYNCVKK